MADPGTVPRMIRVARHADAARFLSAAEPLLAADRARSTIIATVAAGLVSLPDPDLRPTLVVASDSSLAGDPVVGLALRTPPHPLTVLIDPSAADPGEVAAALAGAVVAAGSMPDLISGPREDVDAVAAALAAQGWSTRQHTAMLLYRLVGLVEPYGVRGAARSLDVDDPADLDLASRWAFQFLVETRAVPRPTGPDPELIRRRAARGGVTILWQDGAASVALAGHSAVIGGMARIGPVFTPESLRGNHYGSAVTAAAVRSAQRLGAATVVLFTDADYPTSNAIYRRLGFEPVQDMLELELLPSRVS